MYRYILHRLIWSVPVLIAVSLITFTLMHLVPGGPWTTNRGTRPISKTVQKAIMERYGLDEPLHVQYLSYMLSAVRGDLGPSYDDTRTVNRIIADEFPLSALFGITALSLAFVTAIPLGLLSAIHHNKLISQVGSNIVTVSIGIPGFVWAIVLIIVFAVHLHLVPVQFQRDRWQSWILPVVLLSIPLFALLFRMTRNAAFETIHEDYIRTARMKGLRSRQIHLRHVLRNTLLPVVTLIGPLAADALTGSFVVESIFGIPGLGRTFVSSVVSRDYPLIMGVTLFFATILILFNLIVDVSYTLIDPRISYS